jgi:lipoprotein NlpD
MSRCVAILLVAFLAACAARGPAPVSDRMPTPTTAPVETTPEPPPPVEKPIPTHTVKRGDTLVSIALQYGIDYRELAAWNNIVNPNRIEIGQVLVLAAPAGMPPIAAPIATPLVQAGPPIEARPLANTQIAKVEPRATKVPFTERALSQMERATEGAGPPVAPTPPTPTVEPPAPAMPEPEKAAGTDGEDVDWMWPIKGKVLASFTEASKGVDIGGRKGAPVLAAAGGRVVYAGAGLRGYGKLVIIKHNNTWLSAYAHNDNILVKEQQDVRKGQKIAEMGSSDADQVKLHFEVRRNGKPVDPAKVLPGM